jgi:hypothetical protein
MNKEEEEESLGHNRFLFSPSEVCIYNLIYNNTYSVANNNVDNRRWEASRKKSQ